MRVIKRKILLEFSAKHLQARVPLETWFQLIREGTWESLADVKSVFGSSVDFVGNHRVVFDIKGNDYRLIAEINYRKKFVFVRFLGTHKDYDKADAATVRL